jgi:hypothetical protein
LNKDRKKARMERSIRWSTEGKEDNTKRRNRTAVKRNGRLLLDGLGLKGP